MESTESLRLERRARLKYEWARAWRAAWGFSPALLPMLIATLLVDRPAQTMAFGAAMFVLGAALLWHGRELRRAVLPGALAGLVPLILVLCANQLGHVCDGERCVSVCVPACTLGGVLAGVVVGLSASRPRRAGGFWLAASSLALLTGAMGCVCIGQAGLLGLAMGYALGAGAVLGRAMLKG